MSRKLSLNLYLFVILSCVIGAQPMDSANHEVLHIFQNGYSYDQLHCYKKVDPEDSYGPSSLIVLDDGNLIINDITSNRVKIFSSDYAGTISLSLAARLLNLRIVGNYLLGFDTETFVVSLIDPSNLKALNYEHGVLGSADLAIDDEYFISIDEGPDGSPRLFRILSYDKVREVPFSSILDKKSGEVFTKETITFDCRLKGQYVLRSSKRGYITGFMDKFAFAQSKTYDTKGILKKGEDWLSVQGDFLAIDANGIHYFFYNGGYFQNASRIFVVDQKARILATFEPDRDFDDYTVMSTPSVTSNGDIYYLESNADRGHKLIRIKNTWDPEGRARVDAAPPINVLPAMKPWTATLNDGSVRLRKDQNTESAVLGLLQKGQKVRIFEQSFQKMAIGALNAYWYYVRTDDNKEGWVYGAYLTIDT